MQAGNQSHNGQSHNGNQQGFVLITGLMVLLMLTVIMLTAMRTAALEEMMAGNLRNSNIAFQAAESALREAESLMEIDAAVLPSGVSASQSRVEGQPESNPFHPFQLSNGPFQNTGAVVCAKGFCGPANPPASDNMRGLRNLEGAVRTAQTGITGLNAQPDYVIELLFIEPSTDSRRLYATFRVTTIAFGEDADSEVQLQTTYRAHLRSFIH